MNLERTGLWHLLDGETWLFASAGSEQREDEGGGEEQAHGVGRAGY